MKTISIRIWDRIAPAAVLATVAAIVALSASPASAEPKTFSIGTEQESDFRAAQILTSPHPVIPSEMHEKCFKSCCIARFIINPDGKTDVRLLTSSGDEQLDEITLKTLKRWKFRPATLNGEPVKSTRRLKIEFAVE